MRRPLLTLALLASTSLLLSSCGSPPDKADQSDSGAYESAIPVAEDYDPNGHFNFGYTAFPASWDPTKSVTGADIVFYEPVYDRLLFEDSDGEVHPMLAEQFEGSNDGRTLTLTLQEGLTFADGTPFDAQAVKFNLDRNRGADSKIAGEISQIESVEVIDERTVALHLSGRIGSLPVALADRAGVMVSPSAVSAGTLETEPVGIGPYEVTSQSPGDKVEFERSANYWDPDAQRVATMTYYFMPDDQTRLNALKSGELDGGLINAVEMADVTESGLTPVIKETPLFLYVVFNTDTEPLGDPEVAKALNMTIDREAISQGLYDGYCTPQIQPFPEGSVGYSDEIGDGLDVFPYDPDGAQQILEDKGVSALEVTAVVPPVTSLVKFAEVMQEQFSDVGIQVSIQSIPSAEVVQKFLVDKSVEASLSINTALNDPDAVYGRYLMADSLYNPGGATYPELDKWATEGAASLDPAARESAYEEFGAAWVDNPPHVIPVCMTQLPSAYADTVSGVSQKASGDTNLRGVAVAKD